MKKMYGRKFGIFVGKLDEILGNFILIGVFDFDL